MNLKSQLLLTASGAAIACGILGTGLLAGRSSRRGLELLDRELATGRAALEQSWRLRRAERRGAYDAIARQTYFRAYLLAGDRGQMTYFATATRRAGADDVVVLSNDGQVFATDGDHAAELGDLVREKPLAADGDLIALGGHPADAYEISISGAGRLVVANQLSSDTLRADAEPFGVEVSVAAARTLVSTLPSSTTSELERALKVPGVRALELGGLRYRAVVATFGSGRLLVAVPLSRIDALTTETAQLVALLLGLILIVVLVGALIVITRVTGPMAKLEESARQLGAGRLAESSALAQPIAARVDEIGTLARAFVAAADQLGEVVRVVAELSRDLNDAIRAVDRTANVVSGGATRQEERLRELEDSFAPLAKALEAGAAGLVDAQNGTVALLSELGHLERLAEQAVESADRAARSPQLGRVSVLKALVGQQQGKLEKNLEDLRTLGTRVEEALAEQLTGRQHSRVIQRGLAEIERIAHGHGEEAAALKTAAVALRRDIARLNDTLARLAGRAQRGAGDPRA